ncbi:MAG: hypothetical protein ABGZ17_06100, partial [Planctomycetaceae bacterium]
MLAVTHKTLVTLSVCLLLACVAGWVAGQEQQRGPRSNKKTARPQAPDKSRKDAKNRATGQAAKPQDPELRQYGIYAKTAPIAEKAQAVETTMPLQLNKGDRIALIGNTL